MTANHAHTPSLKEHVHKLVDDWLGLGDLDDRPIEGESDFEQWVDQKIKAGNELSSFAEEVLDEFLGQFKGTKRDVGVELDRIIAAAEQRGAKHLLKDAEQFVSGELQDTPSPNYLEDDYAAGRIDGLTFVQDYLRNRIAQMEGDE